MQTIFKISLILMLLSPIRLSATTNSTKEKTMIIPIKQIKNVLPYVNQETLVVFDIDKTLLQAKQYVGSFFCESHIIMKLKESGLEEKEAIDNAHSIHIKLLDFTPVEAVEKDTSNLIYELAEKKIKVMGLTARSAEAANCTAKQLNSINAPLALNSIHADEVPLDDFARYIDGVLYVSHWGDKGEILVNFFEKIGYTPSHILFVDDSYSRCDEVKKSLEQKNIKCTCVHYTAADESFDSFIPASVYKEIESFIGKDKYIKIFEEIL